jgi:hypothetical protein
MALAYTRTRLARVFTQRCFYLFFALMALLAVAPFLHESGSTRYVSYGVSVFILLAAIAAVGRTPLSFTVAVLLAAPAVGFLYLALKHDVAIWRIYSWAFTAALYFATTAQLLAYVFRRDVMTADKLYGAAAAYLLAGALWAYLYAIVQYFYPGALVAGGQAAATLNPYDFVYFSFTVLPSTGFGDIVPVLPPARALVLLEQVVGVLFVAILIARLAGIFPPRRESRD